MSSTPQNADRPYAEVLDTVAALERQLVMLSAQTGTRANPAAQEQIAQVRKMITDLKTQIRTFPASANTTAKDTAQAAPKPKPNPGPMRSLFGSDPE